MSIETYTAEHLASVQLLTDVKTSEGVETVLAPAFSDAVIEKVADLAAYRRTLPHFRDFLLKTGIPEDAIDNPATPRVDIRPADHDPELATVIHLPMNNGLDANQLYQVANLTALHPHDRIIAIANPGGIGYNANRLSGLCNWAHVSSGDMTSMVTPHLRYLKEQGITYADHVGYSLGADLLVAAAAEADHEVTQALIVEPASVKRRPLVIPGSTPSLAHDFAGSAAALDGYVAANYSKAFNEAREHSPGAFSANLGLARWTNIALARGLARGEFNQHMLKAMKYQPDMQATVVWGTESELADDEAMVDIFKNMEALERHRFDHLEARRATMTHGKAKAAEFISKLHKMRLVGEKHALMNDLLLAGAIDLQANEYAQAA